MSKSPLAVARAALQIGQQELPVHAFKFSPQRYTQTQLFACLALMQFFKTDNRAVCVLLSDFTELRQTLGLARVPHYMTLRLPINDVCANPASLSCNSACGNGRARSSPCPSASRV